MEVNSTTAKVLLKIHESARLAIVLYGAMVIASFATLLPPLALWGCWCAVYLALAQYTLVQYTIVSTTVLGRKDAMESAHVDWSTVVSDNYAARKYQLYGILYSVPVGLLVGSCIQSKGWKEKMGGVGDDALRYVPVSLYLLLALFAIPLLLAIVTLCSAACRAPCPVEWLGRGRPSHSTLPLSWHRWWKEVAPKFFLAVYLILTRAMGFAIHLTVATVVGGNFSSYLPYQKFYWCCLAITILTFLACDAFWQLGAVDPSEGVPKHDKNTCGLRKFMIVIMLLVVAGISWGVFFESSFRDDAYCCSSQRVGLMLLHMPPQADPCYKYTDHADFCNECLKDDMCRGNLLGLLSVIGGVGTYMGFFAATLLLEMLGQFVKGRILWKYGGGGVEQEGLAGTNGAPALLVTSPAGSMAALVQVESK